MAAPDEQNSNSDLGSMRSYLDAHNGVRGLEVLDPSEVERAVRIFHRDGFVVVGDALDADQLAFLRAGSDEAMRTIVALDPDRCGNRSSRRYSFGGSSLTRSMLHLPKWQMLVDLPTATPIVTAIFGSSDYMLRAASGDFCLPGATQYQPLHSDIRDRVDAMTTPFSSFHDPRGHLTTRDLPCQYVCVNVLTVDATRLNGPDPPGPRFAALSGTEPRAGGRARMDAAQYRVSGARGAVQIRDVRAGTAELRTCPITCGRSRTSSSTPHGFTSRSCRASPPPITGDSRLTRRRSHASASSTQPRF